MENRFQVLQNFKVDLDQLRLSAQAFLEKHPFHKEKNQVCLTHRLHSADPYYEGAGSLYDYEKKQFAFDESEFSQFHEEWKSSYLFEVYKNMQTQLPYKVGRVRLMMLKPISCLSVHYDTSLRLHIPIETTTNSLFIFTDQIPIHMPADGSVYLVDTRVPHTALNGDRKKHRIHLVAALL